MRRRHVAMCDWPGRGMDAMTHGTATANRLRSRVLSFVIVAGAVLVVAPGVFGYRTLTILSDSVATLDSGDLLVVAPIRTESLRVGDIVAHEAQAPDRPLVTHRISEVVEPGARPAVRTRGDASGFVAPGAATSLGRDTAWRQAAVVPFAGTMLRAMRHQHVAPTLRWGAPFLVVLLMLRAMWHRVIDLGPPPPLRDARTVPDIANGVQEYDLALPLPRFEDARPARWAPPQDWYPA